MEYRRIPLMGVRGMEFSPAMRFAALALMGLFVAGLVWRGVSVYREDQRAQQAASLDRSGEGGTGAEAAPAARAAPVGQAAPAKAKLVVHVEGAVQRPGVYTFDEGARVNDAVEAAGGALPEGVPGALNLAAPLTDGAKVYIFTRAELQPAAQPAAPADQPRAREASFAPVKSTEAAAAPAGPRQPVSVNINTATAAELEAVPGIGPSTARAIVEHRSKHGAFRQVDDLTAVSGIGPKTLEKLRPYLKV